ncbi:MAG TPA: PilZ domain-containing protein [Dehalococcoidia bacterium]|nr:PilZ domain-containing protein [Dehalococcoidia bacterium]
MAEAAPKLWSYPVPFAGLRAGQPLSLLLLGSNENDHEIMLSGLITRAETAMIAVELQLPVVQADLAPAGAFVGIVRPYGYYERASITEREIGESVTITLAPLPSEAPQPRMRQAARTAGERPSGSQRRASRRVPLPAPWPAFVSGIAGRRALRLRVHVCDLSAGGAKVVSRRPLPEGTELALHLAASEGDVSLNLPLRVAWQRVVNTRAVCGVEFLPLTEPLGDALERLIFGLRWQTPAGTGRAESATTGETTVLFAAPA